MASHRRNKRPSIGSNSYSYVDEHKDEDKPGEQSLIINKTSSSLSFTSLTRRLRGRTTASRKKDDVAASQNYDDDGSDNNDDDDDVPFCCLTLKVGTVLAIFLVICCTLFGTSRVLWRLYHDTLRQEESGASSSSKTTLPNNYWIVSSKDAFGIAQKYQLDDLLQDFNNNNNNNNQKNKNNKNGDSRSLHSFLIEAAALRKQFQQRYGRHARSLLGHGLSSISDMDSDDIHGSTVDDFDSLATLAQALADKRERRNPEQHHEDHEFRILVLGNAAAAGYGNYHAQAYSYHLQRLLQPSFQTLLGLKLTVTNLAMDGAAEFPLSWCLTSQYFYSQSLAASLPGAIIWDFPSRTSASVQRLEAFIRHWSLVASNSSSSGSSTNHGTMPLLIFREQWNDENSGKKKKEMKTTKSKGVDQEENREEEDPQYLTLLKYYRQANVLSDATLLVHEATATGPFFEHAQGGAAGGEAAAQLPRGLADWHKFGGPAGASSLDHIRANLSLQQHQLVAWLVGMHFLAALELLAVRDLNGYNNATSSSSTTTTTTTTTSGNQNSKKNGVSPMLLLDQKKRRETMTTSALPKPLFLKNVEWMDDLSRSSAASSPTTGSSLLHKKQQCYTTLEYMVRDHSMKPIMTTTNYNDEAEGTAVFVDEGQGQAIQQVDSVYIPSNLHKLLLPLGGTNSSDNGNKDDSSATIGQDSELLLPKSGQWYNHLGWVLDMDILTKRHKQRTRSSDFLGFADWKKAYFGAHGSGTLRIFLPIPLAHGDGSGETTTVVAAPNAVKVLILCELPPFDEDDRPSDPGKFRKRLPKPRTTSASCTLREDVSIAVGGITTTTQSLESLGKSTMTPSLYDAPLHPHCRHVVIPPAARLMTRNQAMAITDGKKRTQTTIRDREFGLMVELTVTNPRIVWNQGPCSLSHVIYQPR